MSLLSAPLLPVAAEASIVPTIQHLTQALERLRQEELRRFSKRLSPEQTNSLDELTTALVQRVVQGLAQQLGAARQRGNSTPLLHVLTGLFDLQDAPANAA
ncbi:hypothetical protein [Hymenobacter psychrophilus]|uniref:Glutamyl-tRNAGlu reductase, dimerisation domain n=1 Tax=Hymenobacter psychrophilus TaxID=651662 RepID=A0A1H3HWD9_9BACT|nr:hypothetical protein [Hymenobacter psychrophilus]SDY19575.1 Glutamyl-tRNAGlu reductase, dimerisation domain [Hymenobacter psychrophilus]